MSLSTRKITYVKTHGNDNFVPGAIGNLGSTFPATGKTLKWDMTHTDAGVYILVSNALQKSEVLIPWANVQMVVYAKENNT